MARLTAPTPEENPMPKAMFDTDALISQFESASAAQGDKLRQLVADTTLQALQGRELTLRNVRATLKAVADAAGQGGGEERLARCRPDDAAGQGGGRHG
jgi:hypothetical protein